MTATCVHSMYGLTSGHAYTVAGAEKVKQKGKVYNLIKMRNPWGTELYNGPWSDKDPRWTKQLRKELKAVNANDGIFFIPEKLFLKAFEYYEVLHYQNWKESAKKVQGKSKSTYSYSLNNPVDQEVIIQWEHTAKWNVPSSCP